MGILLLFPFFNPTHHRSPHHPNLPCHPFSERALQRDLKRGLLRLASRKIARGKDEQEEQEKIVSVVRSLQFGLLAALPIERLRPTRIRSEALQSSRACKRNGLGKTQRRVEGPKHSPSSAAAGGGGGIGVLGAALRGVGVAVKVGAVALAPKDSGPPVYRSRREREGSRIGNITDERAKRNQVLSAENSSTLISFQHVLTFRKFLTLLP